MRGFGMDKGGQKRRWYWRGAVLTKFARVAVIYVPP